jgi:Tfp pilus assembly protein PilW
MRAFFRNIQKNQVKNQSGQSIIEVLVATVVVALVMTAIAATLTSSLRNTTEGKFRSYASAHGQEAMEIFLRERSLLGWQQFQEAVISGQFCMNELPADSAAFISMSAGTCSGGIAYSGTEFVREAQVSIASADEIMVEVFVTWQDNGRDREVSLVQVFRNN